MNRTGAGNGAEDADRKTRYLYLWLLVSLFFEYARPLNFVPGLAFLPLNSLLPLSLLLLTCFVKDLRPMPEIFGDSLSKWIVAYFGIIFLSVAWATVTTSTGSRRSNSSTIAA